MDDAHCLALLAAAFRDSAHRPNESEAIATLVWAKTEGMAEVYRRVREYGPTTEPTTERPVDDPTAVEPDGPMCEVCKGRGGVLGRNCPTCDGKGWRPPTYEEEHIDPRSGLPRNPTT